MKDVFSLDVTFPDNGMSSKLDKSWKLSFETQELRPEDIAEISKFKGAFLRLYMAMDTMLKVEEIDVPEIKPEFKSDKTPGQRLRGVLYKIWELNTNKTKTFEEFYKEKMEVIITKFKEQLEP